MKNLIVILVSQQTIPNVMFVKQFLKQNDDLLMVSTEKMKNKENENIKKSLNLPNAIHTIIVDEFNNKDIQSKLSDFDFSPYSNLVVNITGGTKIMSLEAYTFFKKKENCNIFYITKGTEYKKISPYADEVFHFNCELDLEHYFKAYGYEPNYSATSGIDKEYTYSFFDWFINHKEFKHQGVISELQKIRNCKKSDGELCKKFIKKGIYPIDEVEGLSNLLYDINFPTKEGNISKKEIEYLTGNWFEEYIYYKLKDNNIISEKDIICGVMLKNDKASNEFDIVFLKDYQLHIIECKTSIINKDKQSLPNDTIYKLDSLKKELGLFAKSYIATLNKKEDLKENHKERAKLYGMQFLTLNEIKDEEVLIKQIFPKCS